MVEVIKFTNNSNKKIEILIEPSSEYIDLISGESIVVKLNKISNNYNDEFHMVLEDDMLIIYESRQCNMEIFINNELKYYTTPGMPRL